MKQTLFLLSFLLLLAFQSRASHLAGGELRYEYNGSAYIVKLILYRDCSGIPLASTDVVTISSASLSVSYSLTLSRTSYDIVSTPCTGGTNKCYNPSSNIPGYGVGVYTGGFIPSGAANDWVISYTGSARTATTNLTGGSLYLSATLNNLTANNSNAYIPSIPLFYMTSNTYSVPFQIIDPDGDSVVIDRIAPKTGPSTNATYSSGAYSATNPFGPGGIYTVDVPNETLTLKGGSTVGAFNLAFLVKEYRNGTLIASYMRDFICSVLPGSASYSFPAPGSSNNKVAYACPGAAGSIALSFTDPVTSDSVFIEVDTPAGVTGWNFIVSTAPGSPTGYTTISWTAPSTLNPSTLPYFFINLRAKDNACPKSVAQYAVLVKTQQCATDSVWPGDANSDHVANLLDVLAIAVAYNQTGPARPGASTAWVPQWAQNWANHYPFSTVNVKHGDCNGNGVINSGDLGAIATNYGLTHPKGGARNKVTGAPDLFFDFSGITLYPGANVSVPITLGTSSVAVSDLYGLGTNVQINGLTLASQATITTSSSWIGTTANTLEFSKNLSNSTIDWAYSKTDHQNVSGSGVIGMLNFSIPSTAMPGQTINFAFGTTTLIDRDGNLITAFNTVNSDMVIKPADVNNTGIILQRSIVVPNPSGDRAQLHVQLSDAEQVTIRIMDMMGRTVYNKTEQLTSGGNYISLPANVAHGIYTIQVSAGDAQATQVLKWIKE